MRLDRQPRRVSLLVTNHTALLSLASLGAPGSAVAQQCEGGVTRVGSLGLTGFSCSNCTYWTGTADSEKRWSFRSEPEVLGVKAGSPAAGKLRAGDQIVGIDGFLITTSQGGRLMANLPPDQTLAIAYRRDGRERITNITTEAICSDDAHAPLAYTRRPDAVVAPTPPTPSAGIGRPAPSAEAVPAPDAAEPTAPRAPRGVAVPTPSTPARPWLPDAWFGIGIRCTECSWDVDEERRVSEWSFSEPPSITNVDPAGPADRAGLRRGDVILGVDDEDITSEAGGRRFGTVLPGETVVWTIERSGETRHIPVRAEPRPLRDLRYIQPTLSGTPEASTPDAVPLAPNPAMAPQPPGPYALRYAGTVGDAEIEVRAAGSVIVNVIEPGRQIEIVTGDSRTIVRLPNDET